MVRKKDPNLFDLDLMPELTDDMDILFRWLEESKFTRKGKSYQRDQFNRPPEFGQPYDEDSISIIAAPTRRAEKLTRDQIRALKEEYKNKGVSTGLNGVDKNELWHVIRTKHESIRELKFERLPADCMA